ncbi:MAG: hypothetical protein PHW65_05420 [Dehalococcoidales bacterium]|nr:hypothetical protein [Dehalococcoidales bacterium]
MEEKSLKQEKDLSPEELDLLIDDLSKLINRFVDLPFLDENTELLIFRTLLGLIISLLNRLLHVTASNT